MQAAGESDVDAAVKAARKALKDPSWKRLSATDRGILMAKLADLMESKRELFATVDAWDNGRTSALELTERIRKLTAPQAKHTQRHTNPTSQRPSA